MSETPEFNPFQGAQFGIGQIEQQMGQDAYQANVDLNKSMAEHNRKQIETMDRQAGCNEQATASLVKYNEGKALLWLSLARCFGAIAIILFLAGLGGVVWVWRIAL